MRIYELLDPNQITGSTIQPPTVQPPPTQPKPPQQQAGLWDTMKNFMTTPQPIGGSTAPKPAPAPGTNAAGQPGFVDNAVNSTFIGNINRGLTGQSSTPTTPPPKP
jgi:hypothetical protein